MNAKMKFKQEKILYSCKVYRRIHKYWLNKKGEVRHIAFKDYGNNPEIGMSIDWAKYTTAKKSVNSSKNPKVWVKVAVLIAKNIRDIKPLEIEHTPYHKQEHATVWGEKTTEIRMKLLKACQKILVPPFIETNDRTNFNS